jgi:plasmid stabilization system protein ParE
MSVEYSARALADLHEIAEYHAAEAGPTVAEAVVDAIENVIARIERHPESGRPVVQRRGVRMTLLPRYRYKIFYSVRRDAIRIVHIRHTSRRPWP